LKHRERLTYNLPVSFRAQTLIRQRINALQQLATRVIFMQSL
jgi:hypothetical protein